MDRRLATVRIVITEQSIGAWAVNAGLFGLAQGWSGNPFRNKNAVGNQNALKHGKYSPRIKAERLAARQAAWAEERARFEAWVAPIRQACDAQHVRVLEEIRRERAELEAAEASAFEQGHLIEIRFRQDSE